ATGFLAFDKALVGELRKRGIDGTGARPPGAAAALLNIGHDLIAGPRTLLEQGKDRGPHIATASLRVPLSRLRPRPPSRPGTGPTAPVAVPSVPEASLPLTSLRAVTASGHVPGGGPLDLEDHVRQAVEHVRQAGVEVPGSPASCIHQKPPLRCRCGSASRYDHDISTAYVLVTSMTRYDARFSSRAGRGDGGFGFSPGAGCGHMTVS